MGKRILIAEKPDQAKDFYLPLLEKVSGEKLEKKSNYYESKSFILTWFFGHLLEQLKPDEYDEKYKKWEMSDLPIIPEKMMYKYKGDGHKNQGQTIYSLCQKCDEIICGTDPDREGQGIFDTFVKYHKLHKPVLRLWSKSLTDKDLLKAWNSMKEIKYYEKLSAARDLRADSDWLVGMNASRAYSIIANGSLPVGRVLTATLSLIVKRDFEVENYKESFYYQLKGNWNDIVFTYYDESTCKFEDKAILGRIFEKCEKAIFSLSSFKKESKVENPPKPFNLPDLQKEANRRFKFSLSKTLELAQSLYEKKVTTYPRTDSCYLPESDLSEYHELVRRMANDDEKSLLKAEGEKPVCVKNTESPHTALIVTGETASLTDDEKKLYELIRSRFVCAFMIPRNYDQYDLEISNEDADKFKAVIREEINPGFRKLYKEEDPDQNVQEVQIKIDEDQLKNRKETIKELKITETKKSKPKYYTPETLVTAMENCGKHLENTDAKKILSEIKGIGTPATQALYPNQLEKYEYIVEQKGYYISTCKGRKLIEIISPDLKTPELTADWELKLRLVENGALAPDTYRRELYEYIHQIVDTAKSLVGRIDLAAGEKTDLKCPQCRSNIFKKAWGYSCTKECGFAVKTKIADKNVPDIEIEKLIATGESGVIKGFKNSKGGTFDAKLIIKDEDGKKKVSFEFENIECPKCNKGSIIIFDWGAACNERCGFKVSREIAHKKLTDKLLKTLITKKSTGIINNFKSKQDKDFDARLILDNDFNVKFDFGGK